MKAAEWIVEADERSGAAPSASSEKGCDGELLPACEAGWTGPSCDYACDRGVAECGFRYHCHADGRVSGMALSRAHLFGIDPGVEPFEVRDRFEQWVVAHPGDLGMPEGLTEGMLQLEPADDFRVEQGLLTLYRFRQHYAASPAHPQVPVVGEGALLTLEADRTGAVALSGTVVDPRTPYAYASRQASASQALASIAHHTSLRTGIGEASIEVESLQLVAVPWAQQIAWYGVPTAGSMSLGRVIVDADPAVSTRLDLLLYDDGKAYALHNTTPIAVRTQDREQDPWTEPLPESLESTLANGAPLLGSIFDGNGQPQLGTEEVVVLDLHGNRFDMNLYNAVTMSWDFERYTDAGGQFTANEPDDQFRAQRLYHLVQSGYAVIDRVARGKWDSALWLRNPMAQSEFAPGTYRPRIIVGYNHAPTGAAGRASWFMMGQQPQVFSGFPEAIHQPAPNLQNEIIATVDAPLGLVDAEVLLHEVGHDFDVFLAPGYPDNHAPWICPGCKSCSEDTSGESNPLTETVAQMFSMWQLVRIFPSMPHDTCDLMVHFAGGTTNNRKIVHSPGCMNPSDSIGLFIRDDDPACSDASICDKPSNAEADAAMGAAHWCDATEGYNTFSILQAWWNLLHGLYCEPPGPMGVNCVPQAVIWPPGCDQPGSGIACATPDETAGAAFLYAVRSNPTSYRQLADGMARFVACSYGAAAYEDFNKALCDHRIRACDEPPPLVCEQCGNGIREGSEQCDGDDLSSAEGGYVPTCTHFGYEAGTLACQGILGSQPCAYDFSQCTMAGPDEMGMSTGGSMNGESDSSNTDDATGSSGIDSGGDGGCSCVSAEPSDRRGMLIPSSLVFLLLTRWRGRRKLSAGTAVLFLSFGAVSCAECKSDGAFIADAGSSSTTAASSTSTSETGSVPIGWPKDWYGEYHESLGPNFEFGREYPGQVLVWPGNMRIEANGVTIERFGYRVDSETTEWTFSTELDGDVLRMLPPGGEWNVAYPGADEVLIRPGAGCEEVVIEAYGLPSPYEPVFSVRWLRGRICVVDPYDDSVFDDRWMIDLCPGSTPDCGD